MYYLVAYDISRNKSRLLAVKLCKQAGLIRLQRSVFMGSTSPVLITRIKTEMQPVLHPKTDSLCITPLDRTTFKRLLLLGNKTNKEIIAQEMKFVIL